MTTADLKIEISNMLSPTCAKCARVGNHAVCAKCGDHNSADVFKPLPGGMRWNYGRTDLGVLVGCEACGAKSVNPNPYNCDGRSCFVAISGRLSAWEVSFLESQLAWLTRGRSLSPKQLAIVDRCRAKLAAPQDTTATRDAIDCCPKRGKTFRAVCKAIGWTPVSANPRGDGVTKEDMIAVRAAMRAAVYDLTGWDKLPDTATFSDALKAHKKTHPMTKALWALFEYHQFMVNTGRFVEAA
jgi:hypothetical protein